MWGHREAQTTRKHLRIDRVLRVDLVLLRVERVPLRVDGGVVFSGLRAGAGPQIGTEDL